MRDFYFSEFIAAMGEADLRQDVPRSQLDKFRGVLPDVLLHYWETEGWCSYAGGLFWTVNPDDYSCLLETWLQGTPFEGNDRYHVIARSAFGELIAFGETYVGKVTVMCAYNAIMALRSDFNSPAKVPDNAIRVFFGNVEPDLFDVNGEDGSSLFKGASDRLGTLKPNEVYGFVPALTAGGSLTVEHLQKLDLFVHLTILRELSGPPELPYWGVDTRKLLD